MSSPETLICLTPPIDEQYLLKEQRTKREVGEEQKEVTEQRPKREGEEEQKEVSEQLTKREVEKVQQEVTGQRTKRETEEDVTVFYIYFLLDGVDDYNLENMKTYLPEYTELTVYARAAAMELWENVVEHEPQDTISLYAHKVGLS